jgi:hypothetical protein
MRVRSRLIATCLFPLMLSNACQPAQGMGVLSLAKESWRESYAETRPVSAGLYAGAIIGDPKQYIDPAQLMVYLPATNSPKLCVKIITHDARYYAESEYHVSDGSAGLYRVEFPTEYSKQLRKYLAEEVGVVAMLKDRCEDPAFSSLVPASWGTTKDVTRLTIQLKTSGTQTKLVIPDSTSPEGKQVERCRPLAQDIKKTAFDTLCSFTIRDPTLLCSTSVRRRHYGRSVKPRRIKLLCES